MTGACSGRATFGEVALAMGIPRTASVRAVTPAVVASCDRETSTSSCGPCSPMSDVLLLHAGIADPACGHRRSRPSRRRATG